MTKRGKFNTRGRKKVHIGRKVYRKRRYFSFVRVERKENNKYKKNALRRENNLWMRKRK